MSEIEKRDPATYYMPVCGASLPSEPGPMCDRPLGHDGDHRSVSGLFVWPQQSAKDEDV